MQYTQYTCGQPYFRCGHAHVCPGLLLLQASCLCSAGPQQNLSHGGCRCGMSSACHIGGQSWWFWLVELSLTSPFTAWCSNSSRWNRQCQARAQVRRASAEAADKAAMELSSSFAQKVPKLPHTKKHGRRYHELIFCRYFCVFFVFLQVYSWKLNITPFQKRTFHLPNVGKTSIWLWSLLIEIIGAKCARLCGRGRGSRGSAEGSQGVFPSLTTQKLLSDQGKKNNHAIHQVMVLIHSVDLGKFRTSEDTPFHEWYPVPMKKWKCQEFQRLNADICQGPWRRDDIFAGNLVYREALFIDYS